MSAATLGEEFVTAIAMASRLSRRCLPYRRVTAYQRVRTRKEMVREMISQRLPHRASLLLRSWVLGPALLCVLPLLPVLANPHAAAAQHPLSTQRIAELADASAPEAFRLYRELLTFPNDARFPEDILRLNAWLEAQFEQRGFATQQLAMPGSNSILATRAVPGADRTVLIYLQADGQPVDPSLWYQESPWEPTLKERRAGAESVDGNPQDWQTLPWERLYDGPDPEWRMFARSASDSKGPVAQFLTAITLLDRAGVTPGFNMKVIIDTEEELGSPHLADAVIRYRDLLAADMLVIFDGPPHNSGEPTLTFGARGIATLTLTTYGPIVPQHSGHWGNYVPNPAMRLAQLLASMKDHDGRVTIPGFYDGITFDEETAAILAAVPDDVDALHRQVPCASRSLSCRASSASLRRRRQQCRSRSRSQRIRIGLPLVRCAMACSHWRSRHARECGGRSRMMAVASSCRLSRRRGVRCRTRVRSCGCVQARASTSLCATRWTRCSSSTVCTAGLAARTTRSTLHRARSARFPSLRASLGSRWRQCRRPVHRRVENATAQMAFEISIPNVLVSPAAIVSGERHPSGYCA
jgi:acetylornithine deacetylase/succinyl-diaminopimelate desuccinylase-like protein